MAQVPGKRPRTRHQSHTTRPELRQLAARPKHQLDSDDLNSTTCTRLPSERLSALACRSLEPALSGSDSRVNRMRTSQQRSLPQLGADDARRSSHPASQRPRNIARGRHGAERHQLVGSHVPNNLTFQTTSYHCHPRQCLHAEPRSVD